MMLFRFCQMSPPQGLILFVLFPECQRREGFSHFKTKIKRVTGVHIVRLRQFQELRKNDERVSVGQMQSSRYQMNFLVLGEQAVVVIANFFHE